MSRTQADKGHIVVTTGDVAVVAAGASAITASVWWDGVMAAMPHVAQGFIVVCTMAFVGIRAVNEVRKFIRESRDNRKE